MRLVSRLASELPNRALATICVFLSDGKGSKEFGSSLDRFRTLLAAFSRVIQSQTHRWTQVSPVICLSVNSPSRWSRAGLHLIASHSPEASLDRVSRCPFSRGLSGGWKCSGRRAARRALELQPSLSLWAPCLVSSLLLHRTLSLVCQLMSRLLWPESMPSASRTSTSSSRVRTLNRQESRTLTETNFLLSVWRRTWGKFTSSSCFRDWS